MTTDTQIHQINTELTLYNSEQFPLTIHTKALTFTTQDNTLIESRLTFQVNPELYQHIHNQALFNLKPELRGKLTNGEFDSETNIEITASLKPNLLPNLTPHLNYFPDYLQKLSQEDPNNLLLSTESWLGLEVNQQRLPITTGYSTFWNHLNFRDISDENTDSEQISNALISFFESWTEANLEPIANDAISQALLQINQGLEEWIDSSTAGITSDHLTQAVQEIANAFEGLIDFSESDLDEEDIDSQNIFEAMVKFFTTDDWQYTKIQGEPTLQMAFAGKNGRCNCYAKARETAQQFVFYSVSPINAPEHKKQSVSEFIARANYGMIIGNFELDFNNGEIRYKTSINVEETSLTFALIKHLVYANVTMMDEYLPGIIAVIESDISPELAINKIEQNQEINQSSDQIEQLPLIIAVDAQKEHLKTPERNPYILTILTPEEIAQFHHALQVMPPYQHKQANAILEKQKKELISRYGELGETIFIQANIFFREVKIPAKNLKLIQRYSGIAGRIQSLLAQLKNWSQEHKEQPINSPDLKAISDLQTLFNSVEQRLQELPTDALIGNKEVELLVEIEELRAKLVFHKKLV